MLARVAPGRNGRMRSLGGGAGRTRKGVISMRWKAGFGALLVAITMAVGAGTARAADDCGSIYGLCLREAYSRNGTSRTLAVSLLRQRDLIIHYNVIVEGQPQIEVQPGEGFMMAIPANGRATYSVQQCKQGWPVPINYDCEAWEQPIVRVYPPLATCNSYTNTAIANIVEAQNLGCGFGGGRWNPDSQVHLNACLDQGAGFQGFVDGEAGARAGELNACKARIAKANRPVRTTGKAKDGSDPRQQANGGYLTCAGGGMNVQRNDKSVFVTFVPARLSAERAAPEPGQCAWSDRVVGAEESRRIAFTASKDLANELIEAARSGGTFVVAGIPMKQFIMVNAIVEVEGAGAGPTVEPNAGPGEAPAEEAVPPPMESASCPAGSATVSTASVGEDVLNVRKSGSASAAIVTQVPDGSQVNVVGGCAAGAGFAKGKTLKPKGAGGGGAEPQQGNQAAAAGWCRIDQPAQGCVKAEFLAFDAGGGMGGAGLAKTTLRPKGSGKAKDGGAAGQSTFAGNWNVTADDDVGYSMSMTQNGGSVSGSYKGADGSRGTFKGKVKGNVLRFTWKQSDGYSGSGKFALAEDGSSFRGSYSFSSNADDVEGSWNGRRR